MTKIFFAACMYALVCVGFAVYSYSQIDLNLTLSSHWFYQLVQQNLIQLGYFNRPFSSLIFVVLLFLSFILYGFILVNIEKSRIKIHDAWKIILPIYIVAFFAYPAFSHDIFNYMFDARIVTMYGVSPYEFTALDFPNDLWTRFMHWTHRTYPYGPIWLLITIPFSFLGMNKFVITLFLYKLIFLLSTLGAVYKITEITKKIVPHRSHIFSMLFFGLNPLVIIEGVISPHNDVVMFFLAICSISLLFNKKAFLSYFLIVISAGIKFLSIAYLPFMVARKRMSHDMLFIVLAIASVIGLVPVVLMREFYPWYFVPIVGFMSMVRYRPLHIFTIAFTGALLSRYIPYLYYGEYITEAVYVQNIVFCSILLAGCIVTFLNHKKILRI